MASKHYHFKFNFDHDKEIIDRIESQENKNDYIRGLVLSDIAADILRDSIKLGDPDPDQDHDQNKYIDTDMVYQERVDFYNDHCPALNNLDHSINHCDDCVYRFHYKDVDGIEKVGCNLEDAWRTHCSHVLYDAVGGAKRDYPAEFKGLKKGSTEPDIQSFEDYMVNLRKISKTHLNSLYGKMVSNASNDSNALKEEKSDG